MKSYLSAIKARGGKVVLDGDTYDESAKHARALAAKKGLTLVHPYDDPDVIDAAMSAGFPAALADWVPRSSTLADAQERAGRT